MYVESKDILFISLSAGFIVLVVFISLVLIQLTRVLRNAGDITEDVSQTTRSIRQGINNLREKFASYSAFFTSLGPIIKKAAESFKRKSRTKKKNK